MQAYQGYIKAVLTRINTVNGRRYSDDPTVFSWELANEPSTTMDITGTCCAVLCCAVLCCAVLCCPCSDLLCLRSVACANSSSRASLFVHHVQRAWLYVMSHQHLSAMLPAATVVCESAT